MAGMSWGDFLRANPQCLAPRNGTDSSSSIAHDRRPVGFFNLREVRPPLLTSWARIAAGDTRLLVSPSASAGAGGAGGGGGGGGEDAWRAPGAFVAAAVAENEVISAEESFEGGHHGEATIVTALMLGNADSFMERSVLQLMFERARNVADAGPGTYWIDGPAVMLVMLDREEGRAWLRQNARTTTWGSATAATPEEDPV